MGRGGDGGGDGAATSVPGTHVAASVVDETDTKTRRLWLRSIKRSLSAMTAGHCPPSYATSKARLRDRAHRGYTLHGIDSHCVAVREGGGRSHVTSRVIYHEMLIP